MRCPDLPLPLLEREGVLVRRALRPFEVVECASCGGLARVARELGEFVGVCEGDLDCPATRLGAEAAALRVDEGRVLRRISATLGLVGAIEPGALLTGLGRGRIGEETVWFDFCRRPAAEGVSGALAERVGTDDAVRVVLTPSASRVPAGAPRRIGGSTVLWVGFDEVLTLAPEWSVSVDVLAALHRFRGCAPPRETGLMLSSEESRWNGVLLSLSPLGVRLLHELATAPGQVRTRASLAAALWPEDHTRSGALARGVLPHDVDRRLRNVVAEVREQLGVERITTRRGPRETGGFALDVGGAPIRVG